MIRCASRRILRPRARWRSLLAFGQGQGQGWCARGRVARFVLFASAAAREAVRARSHLDRARFACKAMQSPRQGKAPSRKKSTSQRYTDQYSIQVQDILHYTYGDTTGTSTYSYTPTSATDAYTAAHTNTTPRPVKSIRPIAPALTSPRTALLLCSNTNRVAVQCHSCSPASLSFSRSLFLRSQHRCRD